MFLEELQSSGMQERLEADSALGLTAAHLLPHQGTVSAVRSCIPP